MNFLRLWGLKSKKELIRIDFPEQLTQLRRGERISTGGLVGFMTRSEIIPSLPDEFVIRNKNGVIETLKELKADVVVRSIYEVRENSLQNFNQIFYNKIKPNSGYYRKMFEEFRKDYLD